MLIVPPAHRTTNGITIVDLARRRLLSAGGCGIMDVTVLGDEGAESNFLWNGTVYIFQRQPVRGRGAWVGTPQWVPIDYVKSIHSECT